MPIAFRSQSAVVGTGGNATPVEPAGAAEGDVLVAFSIVAAASTITAPTGWTVLYSGTTAPNANHRYNLAWVGRGASAPSLTWVVGASTYREVFVLAFSGASGIEAQAQTQPIATSSVIDPPAVVALSNGAMIVAGGTTWAGGNWVAPANYTIRSSNANANEAGVVASRLLNVAGSEDPGAFSGAAAANDKWEFSLALAPRVEVFPLTYTRVRMRPRAY